MKPLDSCPADCDSFRSQQLTLQLQTAAEAAECAGCADDSVTGRYRVVAVAHDVADGAPRARPSRELGNIAVCCDLARRNPPDNREHTLTEFTHDVRMNFP